jgi:outer membrane protein insertion porin family
MMDHLTRILRSYSLLIVLLTVFFTAESALAQVTIGASVDYTAPLQYRIAGITVVGATQTDPQAIKLFSGLQEGEEIMIPGDKISDAIRKLWKQRLFVDIGVYAAEFRGNDVFLVIQVKEAPRMSKFDFKGIKKSEADNIREKVDLKSMTICNDNMKNNAVAVMKEYYDDKGYFNAKINVLERPDSDPKIQNCVILTFDVDRGERVKIKEIVFEGTGVALETKKLLFLEGKKLKPVLSDASIKRTMKETKEKRWYRIFKSSKYIEEKYEEDKQKIIARYNQEGFRNARIVNDSIYRISSNLIGIKMKIEEDKRFYFRNIDFVGNVKYTTTRLDSIVNIDPGEVYNSSLLDMRLMFNPQGVDVTSLYSDDGYLGVNVIPVETFIEPDSIDIEVRIIEGSQYRIGNVAITGNTKTNDHVIFREIRTRPGDLFSRSDIIRTQRELAALGYFNQEGFDVRTVPRPDEGLVDLEYVLEEKPNDQIQLSGGWGGGRVIGSLQLSFTNFSMRNFFKKGAWSPLPTGDGQRFSVSASSNGLFFRSWNASFTEPWVGGKKPNSLTFSFSDSRQTNGQTKNLRQRDIDASASLREAGYQAGDANPNLQELKVIGGSVSFGKRLQRPDDYFLMYTGLSYQKFKLKRFASFFGDFTDGTSNNISWDFTLTRSSTSDPIYPTYGSQVTFTSKFTPPYTFLREKIGGENIDYASLTDQDKFKYVEYYKFKFTAHWYTALNKHKERKFVLHSNIGMGFLGSYNPKLGQSPFERFYLGGVYLSGYRLDGREFVNLRGYDDLSVTYPNSQTGSPAIVKYSMELRYPLSTNPSATIYAMTFADAGNTWKDLRSFNPFEVYRSAGVGLRIFLPMFGLLGFDYGWRLDDLPNYQEGQMARGQFHFSIGMNLGEL